MKRTEFIDGKPVAVEVDVVEEAFNKWWEQYCFYNSNYNATLTIREAYKAGFQACQNINNPDVGI